MTGVLHIITGLGLGGAERMLVQLASLLQTQGMPQHVVAIGARDACADEIEARGVPVTTLGMRSPAHVFGGMVRLVSLVRQLQPQVLQGWMYHGNLMATAAHRLVPRRRPCRLFWNIRASNMDDARYGKLIRFSARLSGLPDLVLSNSQAGLDYHVGRGFRPRRSAVIPNGIDVDLFRPDPQARVRLREQIGIRPDAVVVLHVARVDPMKDHATFLAAMRHLPSVQGLLVGTGTDKLSTPPNVRGLGARQDVAALCACADLIASTSAFGEGFSNAIAEGMSSGLVPVATDVGDARLIVGSCGRLTMPGDARAFSEAIEAETRLSPAERQSRGMQARAFIAENFTLKKCVDTYWRSYAEACLP